jgi:hypothetical protein
MLHINPPLVKVGSIQLDPVLHVALLSYHVAMHPRLQVGVQRMRRRKLKHSCRRDVHNALSLQESKQ